MPKKVKIPKVECKDCRWWEPWKLPKDKTLHDITKNLRSVPTANVYSKRGDCRSTQSDKGATYSSTTCSYAESKNA